MFLSIDDLKTVSTENIIEDILGGDDNIIEDIVNDNIALMTDYLAVHYDCNAIFATEQKLRNRTILRYLKAMVLYDLYCSTGHNENEMARQRYEDALEWLQQIRNGKQVISNIEKLTDKNGDNSLFISAKSERKYQSNF